MRSPRTTTLLLVGIFLLLIAPLFLKGVTVLRPVLTATGEPVLRPDGHPLYRRDPVGQMKADWQAHSIRAAGLICLIWSAGRGGRYLYKRRKRRA
jgi:hypothetical protein